MGNTSSKKTLPIIALSAAAIGGGVYWYTKSSGSTSQSGSSEGIKDKVNKANQEIDTDELKSRFQRTVELAKQATTQLQEIYNDYGKDIIEQIQQVKKDSEGVVSTAKEAGDELKDVADTAKEAEQELEGVKDQAKQGAEQVSSSNSSSDDSNNSDSENSANQNIQESPEEKIKRKDDQADIEPQEEGKNQRDPNSKGNN
ncbi:hypothetical protein CHL76_03955 [Marinococcus halophilus]|uniref:Uncharacterized protein n=1 Tax=Marinococcus halophilus TaxID=1371 RepID=A0A510Y7I2_MARHA|nr:hypothetical protein [Marinococcus halophilus]OZT80943.1 hypothetical protein CHL76_03955 [Marinococcus halophilus]GEK59325.1 hypothetical protein MHA01_22300 [Marinococcus halophilus]